jgi:hypothetical protein
MSDLTDAPTALGETDKCDFKSSFNAESLGEWCELIKDIVSFANSGGGTILIGINDDGTPSGFDITPLTKLDPATVADKIYKYTDVHFADFNLQTLEKNSIPVFIIRVSRSDIPIVFSKTGNYVADNGKQKNAFHAGMVYFRHGAKSEPATTDDLRRFFEREIDRVKESWLGGIRKVVEAPIGSQVVVVAASDSEKNRTPMSQKFEIVKVPTSDAAHLLDPDAVYPYRQIEVIRQFMQILPEKRINQHDVLCIRRSHAIDAEPRFFYKARFASPRYSAAFVDWLVEEYRRDPQFFEKARDSQKATHVAGPIERVVATASTRQMEGDATAVGKSSS